jgi:FKBP-type peptidyl-prolyl cis-trans isomerase 2
MNVGDGTVVALGYKLFDEQGELVETSDEEGPLTYTHGEGELFPALEAVLEGAEIGSRRRVTLAPEDAYGPYDPAAIVSVPRANLPDDVELQEGDFLSISVEKEELEDWQQGSEGDEDEDDEEEEEEEDGELELLILEVGPDEVILDANHPLAGQEITFELEVLSVTPAENET